MADVKPLNVHIYIMIIMMSRKLLLSTMGYRLMAQSLWPIAYSLLPYFENSISI